MPTVAHALRVSIELAKSMNKERENILENANLLRNGLKELNLETLESESQIVPVVLYEEERALKKQLKLYRRKDLTLERSVRLL